MRRTAGFKTRPSTYSIGLAPTSRARCRACKRAVDKGDIRVVTCVFVRPGRRCDLVCHAACVNVEMVKAMLTVYKSVDNVPIADGVSTEACRIVRKRIARIAREL